MILVNPYTGKTVDAPEGVAERLRAAGFTEATEKSAAKPRGRRSSKSE